MALDVKSRWAWTLSYNGFSISHTSLDQHIDSQLLLSYFVLAHLVSKKLSIHFSAYRYHYKTYIGNNFGRVDILNITRKTSQYIIFI